MNQIATQGSNLRALQPEIGQGRRARLARAVRRSGTLHALQAARDALLGGVRILAYHRILESAEPAGFVFDPGLISASASAFDAQMAIIKRRYRPMSLGDVLGYVERGEALPARAVVITFDDGYEDNHRVAFPILRKHGIRFGQFTVFLPALLKPAPTGCGWCCGRCGMACRNSPKARPPVS